MNTTKTYKRNPVSTPTIRRGSTAAVLMTDSLLKKCLRKEYEPVAFGRTKIDPADEAFSWWIRLRDMKCMRCRTPVTLNPLGLPNSLTNSHYFGRTREATRFEPDNCDTLCFGCHRYWEVENREEYRDFKIKQLGQKRFDTLAIQANTYHKKDRLSEKLYWRAKLREDYLGGVK